MQRFVALDSWRGIAACMVALYHLDAYSHLHGLPFLRHAWLFVDLFFVLSGFVIAANYQQRLLEASARALAAAPGGRYAELRLCGAGRLQLLLLIPAMAPIRSPRTLQHPHKPRDHRRHLLLVHRHLYDFHTWNAQSWSVSAEFYTYIVFAACLLGLRRHAWIALPVAMLGGPLLIATLSERYLGTDYDWGILRCIYGFAVGVAAWNLHARWHARPSRWFGNVAECCAIALISRS